MATLRNYFKILSQCTEIIERINPDFVQMDVGIPSNGKGAHFHGQHDGDDIFFHMRPVTNDYSASPNVFLVQGFTLSEGNREQCMMFGGTYLITGDGYSTLCSDDLPPLDPARRRAEGCWLWEFDENDSHERDEDTCCRLCRVRHTIDELALRIERYLPFRGRGYPLNDEIPAEEPPPEYSEVDTLGNDPPPTYDYGEDTPEGR